jgi:ferredoxin
MVTVEIMGKKHQVPPGITVIQAMWYTGHELVRGIGCLGGVCGACGIVYRTKDSFELKNGMGCCTLVEEGMSVGMIPHFPASQARYKMDEIKNPKEDLVLYYPEAARCVNCNACNRVCPQGIDVRTSVWAAVFGDFQEVADLTINCNMCGLCVSRCVADMAPNLIALYARRSLGAFYQPKPEAVFNRIREIEEGRYDPEWQKILAANEQELQELCRKY